MDNVAVKQSDEGFDIPFLVKTRDGEVKVLTGYTINLTVWTPGDITDELFSGACTIEDADAGTCKYTVAAGDLDTVGRYAAELELVPGQTIFSAGRPVGQVVDGASLDAGTELLAVVPHIGDDGNLALDEAGTARLSSAPMPYAVPGLSA